MFDPGKWLEAVKTAINTAAAYKFALAAVCGIYWVLSSRNLIPSPSWQLQASAFGFIFFAILWMANISSVIWDIFRPRDWFVHYVTISRQRREVEKYIPHMGDKERQIIAYLLEKNQKSLVAAQDGGHAMLLISRAIIVPALAPGQVFYQDNMPMIIPDHIWDVLMRHKNQFPYTAPPPGVVEPYPWRKHFME